MLTCHFDSQPIQTLRELKMLKVMEGITDIPDWYKQASKLPKKGFRVYSSHVVLTEIDLPSWCSRQMERGSNAEGAGYDPKHGRLDDR